MHPYQQDFIEAFKHWDSERMAEVLIKIAELLANKKFSEIPKDALLENDNGI